MVEFPDNLVPQYDGAEVLAKERARSSIAVQELAKHLLSRDGFLERQERIVRVIEKEPLFSKKQQLNLSRPDRYHLGLARAKALRRLVIKHGWDHEEYKMAEYLTDEMSPYHLQYSMFATTITEQANDEQKKYWWPLIESFKVIGCYGQTELGHGSNVRGIECQAKYDVEKKEFILHSPTLTSSKWWNGSLGRTANHAVVIAKLHLPDGKDASGATKYKDHGVHTFMVQIRDMKTHQPLKGVVVGDIGPKYGYTSMDNGFLLFNKVHVPHSALLSRYNTVDPNTGKLSRTGHPAAVYGSLTNTRANIIMHSRLILARAVTIAVRYTSIRRQFRDRDDTDPNGREMAVLDYPTVQIRLFPLLATTFALHYTGEAMHNLYYSTRRSIEKGDFSALAELHSLSSGLKSVCTQYAADGIEICRRSMGGHGFGGGSGLVGINQDYLSKPTVEGDNWMITQQTASYLIKKMTIIADSPSKKAEDATEVLFKEYSPGAKPMLEVVKNGQIDNNKILEAFRWRASSLSFQAYQARVKQKKSWTYLLIQLHRLSGAYSQMILVTNFYKALPSSPLSPETVSVMTKLFQLYSLYTMESDARSFAATGAVSSSSLDELQDTIISLMTDIRPHALRLVDSWSMPDYLLNSALGKYDGKVYEELFDMAYRQNPLNKLTFNIDWRSEEIVLGSGDANKILSKL